MATGERSAASEAVEKDLSFVNANGERLVGRLLDTGSDDCVVLCHGSVTTAVACISSSRLVP